MSVLASECRVTADVRATLRGVTMHPTDPPYVLVEFNPWSRSNRADQESPRAWNDGSWSGAEWAEAVTVPLTVAVKTLDELPGTRRWLEVWQPFVAAWAPSHDDLPLDFAVDDGAGGLTEYVMFGRPRLADPVARTALRGWTLTRCAFRALDPLIYSGGVSGLHTATTGLPSSSGGLIVPFTVPFIIGATVTAGRIQITNAGTAPTALQLRIDGPVQEPRVTLQTPTGPQTLRYHDTLLAGQWLDIDTKARTVLLNGAVSRRGLVSGDWPLLSPGTWELAFDAANFDADALLTVTWRDAWIA